MDMGAENMAPLIERTGGLPSPRGGMQRGGSCRSSQVPKEYCQQAHHHGAGKSQQNDCGK